jgi:hypothetical protein
VVGTFGIHVCEGCGEVYENLGDYWACQESHPGLVVPPADIYLGERPEDED